MRRDLQSRLRRAEKTARSAVGGEYVSLYEREGVLTFHDPFWPRFDWAGRDYWKPWDDGRSFASEQEAVDYLAERGVVVGELYIESYVCQPPAWWRGSVQEWKLYERVTVEEREGFWRSTGSRS